MPKHFEFVFAAYLIWVLVFVFYLFSLYRKERATRRAMERLSASGGEGARRS